jgi:cysteinyl-tRNA synthetase
VIRSFILTAHYSSPIDFSDEALNAAAGGWERINNAVRLARRALATAPDSSDGNGFLATVEEAKRTFIEVMDDDFNTPRALAGLQDFTRDVNTLLNSGTAVGKPVVEAILEVYDRLAGDVLGIVRPDDAATTGDGKREAALIELLINMRADARKNKNFAESDRIRNELARAGVILEDRADGTVWKTE